MKRTIFFLFSCFWLLCANEKAIGQITKADSTDKYSKKHLEFYYSSGGLPDDILKYLAVETITIVGNSQWNWDSAFQTLSYLPNLKRLVLVANKFTQIPTSIRLLTNIEDLSLTQNNFTVLPEEIIELKKLTSISLDRNSDMNLENLFSLIASMNIKKLWISYSKIKDLPTSIGNLHSLETLGLSGNCLKKLPRSLKNLTYLSTISLEDNKFTHIEELYNIPENIRYIGLTGNNTLKEKRAILENKYPTAAIVF